MDSQNTHTAQAIVCKSCGAHLDPDNLSDVVKCPYCGTVYSVSDLMNESDAVRVERINAQREKELQAASMKEAAERERREENKAAIEKFKKSRFAKFLIVCTIISALVATFSLSNRISMSGVIALLQAALYLTAWLLGAGVIKEKRKSQHTLVAVIAFALIIPFFMFAGKSSNSTSKKAEEIDWTDIEMHDYLPEPEKAIGEIHTNTKTSLWLDLNEFSEKDYKSYRDECIQAGYDIDSYESSLSYSAYNPDGYELTISYYSSMEEATIHLYAPEEMSEFEWPANGLGSLLPVPKSSIGNMITDNSEEFLIHVGNTSIGEYKEYVKICEAAGFTIDYDRGEKQYTALNSDGFQLTLRYLGYNKISIALTAPEDSAENSAATSLEETAAPKPIEESKPSETTQSTEATKPTEEPQPTTPLVNGMRPEFKEAMDAYEAFFEEYCDFMKKYSESDGTDISLLLEYTEYMRKYDEMILAFDAWNDEGMNEAESAYYLQVQIRVNNMLLELVSDE